LLQALPYARRLQLERARAPVRTSSLAGLALVLTGAERGTGCVTRAAGLRFEADAKPRFEHGPGFSISHTADPVACVVCAGAEVGLDIEPVPEDAGPAAMRKLARWTATEATLKAGGAGLRRVQAVQLSDASLATSTFDGRRYVLCEFTLPPDLHGHVACAEPLDLAIERVELDGDVVSGAVQRALGLPTQREQ
jgi:phosphopantetheinyl transferase